MRIKGFGATNPGLVRKTNDNVIHCNDEIPLYGICDGAGGAGAGERASAIAMKAVTTMISKRRDDAKSTDASAKSAVVMLKAAIRYANAAVYRAATEDPTLRGMATSITLATVVDNRLVVGHVGNTRLFLFRNNVLTQITQDHTVGQDPTVLLEAPEEGLGEGKQKRGSLTRSIGVCQDVDVDSYQFELLPDDRLLLCSDGLRGIIEATDPYLKALATSSAPDVIPDRLIYIANSHGGGQDNVSAIVVQAEADPERLESELQRRDEALLRIDSVRQVFLFRELELDELLEVADRAVLLVPRGGETIFSEGDVGDAMYLIVEGSCSLTKGGKAVANLGEASHFGEMSLLSNAPRSATIETTERSKLLRISSDDFQEVIRVRPATGVKLLLALGKELSRRLASANER